MLYKPSTSQTINSSILHFGYIFFFVQAGAPVHVYTDGSVLVTHGGTEMGQGLHTKMVQVSYNPSGEPNLTSSSRVVSVTNLLIQFWLIFATD